ncbi:hypothetical protein [Mucilaginibacter sp.]|uniref:hypothetical protein n=1 Tax=Mucilaginibacter sp. TaxID=1882438 RepID=UPI003566D1C8
MEAHELHVEEILKQQMENLAEMIKGTFTLIDTDLYAKQIQLEKLTKGLTLEYRAFKEMLYALSKEEVKKRV